MQISNDDLGRMLGRIEAKVDAQAESLGRLEGGLISLDRKLTERADVHEDRIRALEVANPRKIGEAVLDHEKRICALEQGSAKAGMIGGLGAGIGTAVIIEILKNKLGL